MKPVGVCFMACFPFDNKYYILKEKHHPTCFFKRSVKCLRNFDHLRRDNRHAVGLIGIVGKVFLVVILGQVEFRERREFGDDGIRPQLGLRSIHG